MMALITGVLLMAFCVFALLPGGPLHWGSDAVQFLKGLCPVLAAFIGIICLFIGAADIKDKKEAAKEERKAREIPKESTPTLDTNVSK